MKLSIHLPLIMFVPNVSAISINQYWLVFFLCVLGVKYHVFKFVAINEVLKCGFSIL